MLRYFGALYIFTVKADAKDFTVLVFTSVQENFYEPLAHKLIFLACIVY